MNNYRVERIEMRPHCKRALFVALEALIALGVIAFSIPTIAQRNGIPPVPKSGGQSQSTSGVLLRAPQTQRADDQWLIQKFVPVSITTWWVELGNPIEETGAYPDRVIRTTDGGHSWQDVTPPAATPATQEAHGTSVSGFFLDEKTAWTWTTPFAPNEGIVYRTTNGGLTWVPMGRSPSTNCEFTFVDRVHGWCADIGASAGSEGVMLYRTVNSGATWALVSVTSLTDESSKPDNIPPQCDKSITFTSPSLGWASMYCLGGNPEYSFLYASADGGFTWQPRQIPLPPCHMDDPEDSSEVEFGTPQVKGLAVALLIREGCDHDPGMGVSISTNRGLTWSTQTVPSDAWSAAFVDSRHWRLIDSRAIAATDDGGSHWQNWPLVAHMRDHGFDLKFLSPRLGWAVQSDHEGTVVWQTLDGGHTWTPVNIVVQPHLSHTDERK
jgi:photosystem II stability/assembly factor-like uncharacterized protein